MYDLTNTDELGNRIASFSFNNMQVRVVIQDGEPWFAAHDVAVALEYYKAADLTRLLKDDEKCQHKVRTLGGEQELLVINEKGLYRAIFNSRKPEALAFQDWVFGEVLPAIRKQGFYGQAAGMEGIAAADQAAIYSRPLCLLIPPQAVVTAVMPDGRLEMHGRPYHDTYLYLVIGAPWTLDRIQEDRAPIPHHTLFETPLWFSLLGRRAMMGQCVDTAPARAWLQRLPAAESLIIGNRFEVDELYKTMGCSVEKRLVWK